MNGEEHYKISVKVLQSGKQQKSSDSNGTQGSGLTDVYFSGTGDTFLDAWKDTVSRMPRASFLGFVTLIVVGEQATRENMQGILEQLLRFREFRMNVSILVCSGEANYILKGVPKVLDTLTDEIQGMTSKRLKHYLLSEQVDVNHFTQMLMSDDRDPSAVRIQMPEIEAGESNAKSEEKSIIVKGMAIFQGSKLVGWLDDNETTGFLLLTRNRNYDNALLTVKIGNQKTITYLILKNRIHIKPIIQDGKVSFSCNINVKAEVSEVNKMEFTPDNLQEVRLLLAEKIKEIAKKTIEKLHEFYSDPIGLRQVIHENNLKAWEQTFKTAPRSEILSSDINLNVKVEIVGGGNIVQSIPLRK